MGLRAYQEDLLRRLARTLAALPPAPLDDFRRGAGPHPCSATAQMATGGGKTHMAAELLRRYHQRNPGRRSAFVDDLIEITSDTVARFRRAGLDVGMVAASAPAELVRPDAQVQVCQLQTLVARGEMPPADLVIWDEAHGIEADDAQRLVRAWAPGMLIGLTATPSRGDGKGLGRTFKVLVPGPQTAWLQKHGACPGCGAELPVGPHRCDPEVEYQVAPYLVPIEVIAPSSTYLESGVAMDPVAAYRRFCATRLPLGRPSRALVFCADGQARATVQAFEEAGVAAELLAGDTKRKVRATQRDRLAAGQLLVLCTVDCATKGWDCPAVDTVILTRGVQVPGVFLQMVGRALRPDPTTDKTRARLIDLRGVVYLHGLPDEDRVWSLADEAVTLAKDTVSYSRCGACLWLGPARPSGSPCPRCEALLGRPVKPLRVLRAEKLKRLEAMPIEARVKAYRAAMQRRAEIIASRMPEHRRAVWVENWVGNVVQTFEERLRAQAAVSR